MSLVRHEFLTRNALSSPLLASLTAVGYDVPIMFAASLSEMILPWRLRAACSVSALTLRLRFFVIGRLAGYNQKACSRENTLVTGRYLPKMGTCLAAFGVLFQLWGYLKMSNKVTLCCKQDASLLPFCCRQC